MRRAIVMLLCAGLFFVIGTVAVGADQARGPTQSAGPSGAGAVGALQRALRGFANRLAQPAPLRSTVKGALTVPRVTGVPRGVACPVASGAVCAGRPCRLFTTNAASTAIVLRSSGPLSARKTCTSRPMVRSEPISASSGTP